MTLLPELKREVARVSERLWTAGWVANHDGNVSARTTSGFLITPTALSKRLAGPETLAECDAEGRPRGKKKPPSEVALHAAAYRARPDVRAVLHAHPPHASAFALAQRELQPVAMPEVVVSLGPRIPLVRLALPKDPAVGPAVAEALGAADAALLAGNGALTVGPDLETAYLRMELLEHYARILSVCLGSGLAVPALGEADLARLVEMRKQAGLHREPAAGAPAAPASSSIRQVVEDEVRRVLSGQRK